MGRLWKRNFLAILVLGTLSWAAECRAQGRDPAEFLRRLDENGDGRLDRNEFERMPSFLRDSMRDRIDMSRSYRIEEVADIQRRAMEDMRARGGFGGPGGGIFFGPGGGGPPGGDRRDLSRPDDSRRDFGRGESGRGDSGRGEPGRGGDAGRGDSRTPSFNGKKTETKKKERLPIIARLPDAYLAKDTNHDNQIGFYEWSRTDIAGFKKLDRNGDGFLTAQELGGTPGTKSTATNSTAVASVAGSREPDRSRSEPSRSDSSRRDSRRDRDSGDRRQFGPPPGSGAGTPSVPQTPAETSFTFMDRDKDGKLSEEEWKNSIRAKPMFEKAKIEVKLPMAKEDFIAKYNQASAAGS